MHEIKKYGAHRCWRRYIDSFGNEQGEAVAKNRQMLKSQYFSAEICFYLAWSVV